MWHPRALAGGLTVLAAAALVVMAAKCTPPQARSRATASEALHLPTPAGGVEGTGDDDDEAIVEDARRYPARTFTFPLERYELRIVDVGMSTALDDVLQRTDAEFVVNAGFFGRDTRPVGLAMSEGVELSRLARSASGGVVTFDGERAELNETESFVLPRVTRFAIQCRPRLVVDGQPNVRSDDGRRSARSALCLRDAGRTLEVVVVRAADVAEEGPSLYALGRWLARRGCDGALNLDGGPSTGFAHRAPSVAPARSSVETLAPRAPIRHAIVVRPH